MLSRAYQQTGGLAANELLDFDNLHRRYSQLPVVFFTHDKYLCDYMGEWESKRHFKGKKIVFLVRDPRDVVVSQFFQWRFRMRPNKKFINDYPRHGADISNWEFVLNPQVGVLRIIEFLNLWAKVIPEHKDILVIRYEDMRANPKAVLEQILVFTESSISPEYLEKAVDFADYGNMKKMERNKFFKRSGTRVKPGNMLNPQSFKVRKAKVGGFRDYFTDEQSGELEKMIEGLDPMYGYGSSCSELGPGHAWSQTINVDNTSGCTR